MAQSCFWIAEEIDLQHVESAIEFGSIGTAKGKFTVGDGFGSCWLERNSNLPRADDTRRK